MSGGYYDYGDAAKDIGNNLGNVFSSIGANAKAEEEKKKLKGYDEGFLNWLTDYQKPQQPIDIPAPPTQIPAMEGPALPQGMQEPDPSVAPHEAALPGHAPYSSQYLDNPQSLIDAQKAKADQANAALTEDPNRTMNILLEAKKRGVSPDMGSLLEFIAKQHETSAANKFKSEESDKARKERSVIESTRQAARTKATIDREHFQAEQNKLARDLRERMGKRSKSGALDADDIRAATDSELDALSKTLDDQESMIMDPVPPENDYDETGKLAYRSDLGIVGRQKMDIYKVKSALEREKAIRSANKPGRESARAPRPQSAQTPTQPKAYSSKQEILQAKANGEVVSGQKVSTPFGIVTVP